MDHARGSAIKHHKVSTKSKHRMIGSERWSDAIGDQKDSTLGIRYEIMKKK
jgi:hypothetical protein